MTTNVEECCELLGPANEFLQLLSLLVQRSLVFQEISTDLVVFEILLGFRVLRRNATLWRSNGDLGVGSQDMIRMCKFWL